jgi:nucleotide-binding universal stress UspA family protein
MITLETILCPVDLSETSRTVLGYAVALARLYGARLRVLSVVAAPSWPPALAPAAVTGLTIEMRKTLSDELEQLIQPALAAGVPTDVQLEEGYVVAEILEYARSADLIVMGTHGRSGFDRLVLGSVAEKIIRKAESPVLTVPPSPAGAAAAAPRLRAILCAIDFSDLSARAVDYAVSLATAMHARLVLTTVLDWPPTRGKVGAHEHGLDAFRTEWETEAANELRQIVPADVRRAIAIEELLAVGRPADEIVRLAREHEIDLIVLGVHGRGAVERAMLGSTVDRVIRRATCPVLTVRIR